MSATLTQFFIIEAVSHEPLEPASETYLIQTHLDDGVSRAAPRTLTGIANVRWFLNDNGVDERRVALAVEELSARRHVMVSSRLSAVYAA